MKRRSDIGSATVITLTACAVLALVTGVLAEAGASAVTRHRAALAADAAAIAAASRASEGPGVACASAARALAVDDARLVECSVDGPFVVVRDRVHAPGWMAWAGWAAGAARAGPDANAEEAGGVAPAS